MFGIANYIASALSRSHKEQREPLSNPKKIFQQPRGPPVHPTRNRNTTRTSLFLVLILSLVSTTLCQVPLFNPPSTSPNPQTGRRADYLLRGTGVTSDVDPDAVRAAVEYEILEDQMSAAVRDHAAANARLGIFRSIPDIAFGQLAFVAFLFISAGDFIGLGATLSGIGGVVLIDEIDAAVEIGMVNDPELSTLQFSSSSAAAVNSPQRYERVGNGRSTLFSGSHRQSRGKRTGYLRNSNHTRRMEQEQTQSERLTFNECVQAFMSGDYYGKHGKGANGCAGSPGEASALAELIITSVALAVISPGLILVAIAHEVIVDRGRANIAISTNNLELALFSDRIARALEIERARAESVLPPESEDDVESDLGPLIGLRDEDLFPGYFYGSWRSTSSESTPVNRIWSLTAAYTGMFTYQSDQTRQSIRHLSLDDNHIRTSLETHSSEGQVLLSSYSLSEVRTRVVLKQPSSQSHNDTTSSTNQSTKQSNSTKSNSYRGSTSQDHLPRRRIRLADIDTFGIFLGWDETASWHWYKYNLTLQTLTDVNDQSQVFSRI